MSDTIKVLGQSNPTINVLTDIYTVPALKSTTISTIIICNTGDSDESFRLSVAVAGEADAKKQYIYYDLILEAKDTFAATIGSTLATTDVIRARATSGNFSFNIFGVEMGA